MDKDLDIQIVEALKAYLASGVEDQVDYQGSVSLSVSEGSSFKPVDLR